MDKEGWVEIWINYCGVFKIMIFSWCDVGVIYLGVYEDIGDYCEWI